MIMLHGITEEDLQWERFNCIRIGSIYAIVTDVSPALLQGDPEATKDAVTEHHHYLTRVHDRIPVVPVRFGQAFLSREELLQAFHNDRTDWLNLLEKVRNNAEFNLAMDISAELLSSKRSSGHGDQTHN
ncbi:MAG: GvpL/GvpF family gas vesicle protein, partial [Pseudomonadota bacterium]